MKRAKLPTKPMPASRVGPQKATSQVLRYGFLLLCIGAALGLAVKVRHWRSRSKSIPQIHAIVVLPLRNPGGDADRYLADGITEKLISDLGRISAVPVISRTSAMRLRQTNRSIPEIARQLGVDGVVDGSVVREDNQIRITARLSAGKTGRQLWKQEYSGKFSSALQLGSAIAHDIARQIRTGVGSPVQVGAPAVHQTDADVEDAYLQGEYFLNSATSPEPYQEAMGYFQNAIEKDPSFAPAYAGLAAVYWELGDNGLLEYSKAYSQAELAARKAIELDSNLAEGHAVLAESLIDFDWDWTAAEAEFRRALELNPSSSTAHFTYAHYLARVGRAQEAISEAETGLKLDPISLDAYHYIAYIYYACRRYDRGLESIRKAAELYRTSPQNPLHWDLAVIYVEKGNFQKAIDQFRVIGDFPHPLGHMGNAYARAGQIENANQVIAKLRVHAAKDGVGTYEIALVYAGLGRKDEAFAWLEKSYRVHDKGLTFLKIDPCVDPLRSDPRFQNLLRRVGLGG
jgi:TolB-like protein/Tfp pilus assembly protein PilF